MRAIGLLGLAAAAALFACGGNDARVVRSSEGSLARGFASSAQSNGVPRDLLVAIAQVEGALAMPRAPAVEEDNPVPAAGPLQLRHGRLDTLARGAALVGAREIDLRRDADLALEAGARVLAEVGARTGAKPGDLASWTTAVEEMSGYADEPHRRDYARRVFATLQRGGSFAARDGETIDLAPHAVALPAIVESPFAGAEYPGAEYFPTSCTNKCDTDRAGNAISEIVIHDTEGSWDASVATLQNDSGKSVQYIVGTDGKVGQFVPESYTAWHAGNYYVNQRSVGIEHVGYANQPFTEPQYDASAKLVGYLVAKYGVAKDRSHVFGHDQVPNGNAIGESAPVCMDSPATCEASSSYGGADNHHDPGDWEWPTYMPRFGGTAKCNDAYSLWNCSYDHSKAIRCANGVVEVEVCDGPGACESQPLGVNDVCHKATSAGDAGSAGDDGGSTPPIGTPPPEGDAGSSAPPPPAIGGGTTSGSDPAPSPGDPAGGASGGTGSSGGCSVARDRSTSEAWVVALGIVIGLRTSRRRRRAPARS